MGMDVYGREPEKELGKYFRSNVWWWRPLWNYTAEIDRFYAEQKNELRKALDYLCLGEPKIINLNIGTGKGTSVLELVKILVIKIYL